MKANSRLNKQACSLAFLKQITCTRAPFPLPPSMVGKDGENSPLRELRWTRSLGSGRQKGKSARTSALGPAACTAGTVLMEMGGLASRAIPRSLGIPNVCLTRRLRKVVTSWRHPAPLLLRTNNVSVIDFKIAEIMPDGCGARL